MTHSKPPRRGSHRNEAFQGVKATTDTALKTGDMGLPEHRQVTQLNRQNTTAIQEALQIDSDVRKLCILSIKDNNQSLFDWYFSAASQNYGLVTTLTTCMSSRVP